jgi:drug/metabolite transporter (DMT)-like permease
MNRARIYPVVIVLAAAFLSGLSVPISRLLLNRIEPVLMSALLYLGSAAGLIILVYLRRIARYPGSAESRLRRSDIPWLAGSITLGGIVAPFF